MSYTLCRDYNVEITQENIAFPPCCQKLSEIVVLFVQGKSRDGDFETFCTLKFGSTLQTPFPNKHVQNYESSRLSTYSISTIEN